MKKYNYKDFWNIIDIFNNANVLKHIIIISSWAEYIYSQSELLSGFTANLRTLDIDFLIPNVRKPSPAINLLYQLEEKGYLFVEDRLVGTTKIFTPEQMEIEFLVAQMGSGLQSTLKTNLGVTAQAIRNLSILKNNMLTVFCYDYSLNVPTPEAYILQKIIINKDRNQKAEKDLESIRNLAPFVNGCKSMEIMNQLTKKEKSLVREFLAINKEIQLFD